MRLIYLAILTALASCGEPEDITAHKVAIAESQAAWVAAYNENDWQALANFFTEDALLMPPGDAILMGRDAIADWEEANEAGYQIRLEIDSIDVSRDIAAVYGSSCLTIPTENGLVFDAGKYVEVRRLSETGAWLIAADIFNSDGVDDLNEC